MRNAVIAMLLAATGCTAMGRGAVLDRARLDFPGCDEPEIVHAENFRYYTRVCDQIVAYTLEPGGVISREDGVGQPDSRPGSR